MTLKTSFLQHGQEAGIQKHEYNYFNMILVGGKSKTLFVGTRLPFRTKCNQKSKKVFYCYAFILLYFIHLYHRFL